jgi:hypothetical protein
MADLMKFVKDEFVTRKDFLISELETLLLFSTKLKRVKKQELSSLKELLFKEEVLVTQKLLLSVKCLELLE